MPSEERKQSQQGVPGVCSKGPCAHPCVVGTPEGLQLCDDCWRSYCSLYFYAILSKRCNNHAGLHRVAKTRTLPILQQVRAKWNGRQNTQLLRKRILSFKCLGQIQVSLPPRVKALANLLHASWLETPQLKMRPRVL